MNKLFLFSFLSSCGLGLNIKKWGQDSFRQTQNPNKQLYISDEQIFKAIKKYFFLEKIRKQKEKEEQRIHQEKMQKILDGQIAQKKRKKTTKKKKVLAITLPSWEEKL